MRKSSTPFFPAADESEYRPIFFKKSHLLNFDSQPTYVVLT